MAYPYNTASQQQTYPMGNSSISNSMGSNPMTSPIGNVAMPAQNIQPLFPQPQGNVYNINSTLEVANVPVGAGVSVALCMPENVMYIKMMQNGTPLFYPYKIVPFTNEAESTNVQTTQTVQSNESAIDIAEQLKEYNNRISQLEEILKKKKGVDFEL